jgi:signal transduction histidine kinase
MSLKSVVKLKNSLLFRMTVLYAATFMILAIIGFTIFYYRIYTLSINRIDQELYEDSQSYAELMLQSGFAAVRDEILSDAKSEDPEKEFYRVFNTEGKILVSTDMSTWGNVDHYRALNQLRGTNSGYFVQTITFSGKSSVRTVAVHIGPTLLLQIGETLEDTEEYLDIFRDLLVILIVSFVIISAAIGWNLAQRSLAGMREVTQAAEDITNGDYDRRVEVAGQFREVERLGAAFNTMLDRIQNLLQSMQQINDNIAHDLRSPLARIRGIAEMTIVKNKDIQDFKEMAVSTIEECDTLIDMINTMLDITEIEAGVDTAKMEPFDLDILISEACDLFRPLAAAKSIDLQSTIVGPLSFKGDRKRMQRVVTNLIENAIKYTPEHGLVEIDAINENRQLRIDVKDTGSGIAEKDLPLIFQRFYRCDQSRSQGGVGLGLSLVKAYTESMNGEVFVKSAPNQGSLFSLRFATAASSPQVINS